MRVHLALIATVAAAAFVAGCGGGDGGGGAGGAATAKESAAHLVPATAQVFVALNTDFSSDQIESADAVLKKFPVRERLLSWIRKSIAQSGIDVAALRDAAGPEVDIAVLDADRDLTVGFTQPRDDTDFVRLLDSVDKPVKHIAKDGWVVFSDRQEALDAVKDATAALADRPAFQNAIADLPEETLAKAYVARGGLRSAPGGSAIPNGAATAVAGARWVSAAALAHDDGIELQLRASGSDVPGGKPYVSSLDDLIPSGSLLALSVRDLGRALQQVISAGIPYLSSLERMFGAGLADLRDAGSGEGVLYVRPGTPIPEVTVITKPKPEDAHRAALAVDRLVRALAPAGSHPPTTVTIDGATMRRAVIDPVAFVYGVVDGKLVVTNNEETVRHVKDGGGEPLADDKTFQEVRDASAMPDETNGWLYVNFKDGVPLVEALAQLLDERIPPDVLDNLRPLRSGIVYGTRDGDTQTIKAFVQTS